MSSTRRKSIFSTAESARYGRAREFSTIFESSSQSGELDHYDRRLELEVTEEYQIHEEQKEYKLSHFKAWLLATILEDTISQLRILDSCNTELRLIKTMFEISALTADKFGVQRPSVEDDLDKVDPKNLDCPKYKLDKLESDREVIKQVLCETYQNLCVERDFNILTEVVRQIVENNERLHRLADEESRNKTLHRETHRQLRQLRNHFKSVAYDSNSEIEKLRSSVEHVELNARVRERYVDGWQRSRAEQHRLTIDNKEDAPARAIAEMKRKIEQEQHVHTEIELLTTINTNEVLEKVEEWMAKYERDTESIGLKIQIMKNDYEDMQNNNKLLEEKIKRHAELMKNWVTFKEEREAARQHCEKMNNSAIIIQAWWRGLLVRNQLGPYRPIKKKGGSKKK